MKYAAALEKLKNRGATTSNKTFDCHKGKFINRAPVIQGHLNVVENMETEVELFLLHSQDQPKTANNRVEKTVIQSRPSFDVEIIQEPVLCKKSALADRQTGNESEEDPLEKVVMEKTKHRVISEVSQKAHSGLNYELTQECLLELEPLVHDMDLLTSFNLPVKRTHSMAHCSQIDEIKVIEHEETNEVVVIEAPAKPE